MLNKKYFINKIKSINNGTLKLVEGERKWYNLELHILKLQWERNLIDGWNIDIYKNNEHIGTIEIDYNLDKITYTFNNETHLYGE